MNQLYTRWGQELDREHVKEEYPRPRLKRESYVNMNGLWEYAVRTGGADSKQFPLLEKYDGEILVPFSPESSLSGVNHILQPNETLYYRKQFAVPSQWQQSRILLHFGAVDQECRVWCDGKYLGEHQGGYLPFTLELTDVLGQNPEQEWHELTLAVKDATEQAPFARGKQKLVRKGHMASIFYTPQSGIWKTVWMESVPQQFMEELHLVPDIDAGRVHLEVSLNTREHITASESGSTAAFATPETTLGCSGDWQSGRGSYRILFQGKQIAQGELMAPVPRVIPTGKRNQGATLAETQQTIIADISLPKEEIHLWTPDNPCLYDVDISWGEDRISSYFAMRRFGREKDEKGIWRFTLNGQPFFFNGVLDQGYWPDGLLTAPSDEALVYDIEKLKELGFNTIRKHVKIEEERFYYHCDRLGMVVWQDMPNGGGEMNLFFVTDLPNALPFLGRCVKDCHYGLFKRRDEAGRKQFCQELEGMIMLLREYPCIALWTPFNEGWGQFDAHEATALIRKLDDTRLINEACGWFDQGGGDVYSIHNYLRPLKAAPKPDRVVALTEFGGYACPTPGHMACQKEFGYKGYQNKQQLTNAYVELWHRDVLPWIDRGVSAAIYTQTSDIEEEINGFLTYDREVEKLDKGSVQAINRDISQKYESIHICVTKP